MAWNDFLIAPAVFLRFPRVLEVSRLPKKAKAKEIGSSAALVVCVQVAAQVLAAYFQLIRTYFNAVLAFKEACEDA